MNDENSILHLDAPQAEHDAVSLHELLRFAAALANEINQDRFAGVVPDDSATVALCKTLDICLSILEDK